MTDRGEREAIQAAITVIVACGRAGDRLSDFAAEQVTTAWAAA